MSLENQLAEAHALLAKVDETGLLWRHAMELDAEVAGFLYRMREAKSQTNANKVPLIERHRYGKTRIIRA